MILSLTKALAIGGIWTFLMAADAADEARKAKEAAEQAAHAQQGSFCEVKAAGLCPGCAISCPVGVAAVCVGGEEGWQGEGCSGTWHCARPPSCSCAEKKP